MIYKLKINSLEIPGAFFYDKDFGFYFFSDYQVEITLKEVSFDIVDDLITINSYFPSIKLLIRFLDSSRE